MVTQICFRLRSLPFSGFLLAITVYVLSTLQQFPGVSLKDDPDPSKGRPQSQNVILTLSQNRFLLNSERGAGVGAVCTNITRQGSCSH